MNLSGNIGKGFNLATVQLYGSLGSTEQLQSHSVLLSTHALSIAASNGVAVTAKLDYLLTYRRRGTVTRLSRSTSSLYTEPG